MSTDGSNTPPADPRPSSDTAPLNPAMKQVRDKTYGPDAQGRDPMDTVSVKKDEGKHWPAIWAAATIIGVIIAIILLVF